MIKCHRFRQLGLEEFCELLTGDRPLLFREVFTPSQINLLDFPRFCQVLGDVEVRVRTLDSNGERQEHGVPLSEYYKKLTEVEDPGYVAKNVMYSHYFSRLGLDGIPGTLFEKFPQGYLWLGGSGSKSSLHKDAPHNLTLQLYGAKQWTVFSRDNSQFLNYPLNNDELEWSPYKLGKFETCPSAEKAVPITVTLNPGDLLFLPRLWSHCVENLTNSIMVNYFFKTFLPDGRPRLNWKGD